ncbi:MAG: methylmalonyl-CoA mutase, partial [Desulfobaccales bacterium]
MSDPQKLEEVKAAKAKYDETVAKVLTKTPERKADFVNTSGIPIARVYTPLDMADFDYLQQLGMPGQYPYT